MDPCKVYGESAADLVFDAPRQDIFENRFTWLRTRYPSATSNHLSALSNSAAGIYLVEHTKCTSRSQLEWALQMVLDHGGEGFVPANRLMLREAGSHYIFERSTTLYKLKPTYADNVRVIDYSPGTGQITGEVGALVVELNGKQFRVGSGLTMALRVRPPPIGVTVRVIHGGLTSQGIPRFPRYSGIILK